jgi:hypothetical protein
MTALYGRYRVGDANVREGEEDDNAVRVGEGDPRVGDAKFDIFLVDGIYDDAILVCKRVGEVEVMVGGLVIVGGVFVVLIGVVVVLPPNSDAGIE